MPLVRDAYRHDLRLTRRAYAEQVATVAVSPKLAYTSYIPHGLVANWTDDGGAVFGTQIEAAKHHRDGESFGHWITARGLTRMARREHKHQLRFLPLHVAMEGFLALHFGGPSIAWTEYSNQAKRTGLSPRIETAMPGRLIVGLEDALRLFEVHRNQVGILVFVADALASAFVVPHPEDYVALHATLLTDFYGELIWRYGLLATENTIHPEPIDDSQIHCVDDLRRAVGELRQRWSSLSELMTAGLFSNELNLQRVYRFRPFTLSRFSTDLEPNTENMIGEWIVSDDGDLQYLKTYRLSAAQTRRAYLLKTLAAHDWSLEACAGALGCRTSELILRLENAGFGYLLHQHVLDGARAKERRL